jgi:hypothetical protein
MPARTSRATSTRSGEAGTGLIGSIVGVTAFLVLLLFACQLAFNLYATSAVTAVAYDAAAEVANAGEAAGPTRAATAEAHARQILSRFERGGGSLTFAWRLGDPAAVAVTVTAERPGLLAHVRIPFSKIVRTVRVRREIVR